MDKQLLEKTNAIGTIGCIVYEAVYKCLMSAGFSITHCMAAADDAEQATKEKLWKVQ